MKGRRKRGIQYVSYDYESAYCNRLEDLDDFFVKNIFQEYKKVMYALKEIRSGEQLEIEIYPQFTRLEDVPEEGKKKKDNREAQKNLNDKNARKYLERLINHNFDNRDIWITLTYDEEHLPSDMGEAQKNMQNYVRRINYQRKKRGLKNAKYVYVTEVTEKGRCHHHIVMDGDMELETVERCWKFGGRNELRRLQKDENGLSGVANYIVKEKQRKKSEKRWSSSHGLKEPEVKVMHSKQPAKGQGNYRKIERYVRELRKGDGHIREQMGRWYPDYAFTDGGVFYNDFNGLFYIRARMRKIMKNVIIPRTKSDFPKNTQKEKKEIKNKEKKDRKLENP